MSDPLDPVEALRRIAEGVEHWDAERDADSISVLWRIGDLARAALAALPAPVPDTERRMAWLRELAAEGGDTGTVATAALSVIDRLTSAAPVPEGVPEDRQRFAEDAALWIDPARLGGTVAASGTRLGARWIAEYVWEGAYDELRSGWDYLSERQILVACWWVATTGPRRYRKAWGEWAAEAHEALARKDTLPEPPPSRLVPLSDTPHEEGADR